MLHRAPLRPAAPRLTCLTSTVPVMVSSQPPCAERGRAQAAQQMVAAARCSAALQAPHIAARSSTWQDWKGGVAASSGSPPLQEACSHAAPQSRGATVGAPHARLEAGWDASGGCSIDTQRWHMLCLIAVSTPTWNRNCSGPFSGRYHVCFRSACCPVSRPYRVGTVPAGSRHRGRVSGCMASAGGMSAPPVHVHTWLHGDSTGGRHAQQQLRRRHREQRQRRCTFQDARHLGGGGGGGGAAAQQAAPFPNQRIKFEAAAAVTRLRRRSAFQG